MVDLVGKHALVTGGGTGVGAAIAVMLAEAGANVTITGRTDTTLREIADSHANINWVVCDVTDAGAVNAAFASIPRVDIVVANAGAAVSVPFSKMTADDLNAMLDVNLIGVFNVWKAALPGMQAAGWGRMIAIASTAGLKGYAYVSGYSAAKHGVVGLTRSLAQELTRSNITVNVVCPGFVETPMLERSILNIMEKTGGTRAAAETALQSGNPQKRFVQPTEVADTVSWLCGEGAGAINGQSISISGGEI